MLNRNFNEWLSKFKTSISDYTYYVDFEKIYKNVDKVKEELNILNSLIGSKNIEEEFQNILIKYPETLECIPLLLAVRSQEIFIKDEINEYLFKFEINALLKEVEIIEERPEEIEKIELDEWYIISYDKDGRHHISTNRKDRDIYIPIINKILDEIHLLKKEDEKEWILK